MENEKEVEEVDWTQFEKGQTFLLICSIRMYDEYLQIIEAHGAGYHPDLPVVIRAMVQNYGPDLSDLGVNFDCIYPSDPGVYRLVCELTADGDPEEMLSFQVMSYEKIHIPMMTKTTFSNNRTSDSIDAATEQDPPVESTQVENMSIKW